MELETEVRIESPISQNSLRDRFVINSKKSHPFETFVKYVDKKEKRAEERVGNFKILFASIVVDE